jgi:hypothetical protein
VKVKRLGGKPVLVASEMRGRWWWGDGMPASPKMADKLSSSKGEAARMLRDSRGEVRWGAGEPPKLEKEDEVVEVVLEKEEEA